MQNNYISHFGLPSLDVLLRSKIDKVDELVNNLKYNDINEDEAFNKALSTIKDKILITPIDIEDPKFKDFIYEKHNLSFEQSMYGYKKDHYIHEIIFNYTGDKELFLHSPERISYLSSDNGIIEPLHNLIKVYVDLEELNPNMAIEEAKALLRLTLSIAKSNSESVKLWNMSMNDNLEKRIESKRIQLQELFG